MLPPTCYLPQDTTYRKHTWRMGLSSSSRFQKIAEYAPIKDYTGCLGLLQECHTFLQRVEGFAPRDAHLQKLQESVCLQQAICESMQAAELGNRLLSAVEMNGVDTHTVQDSLHHYRQALRKARLLHLDSEGVVLSRIGKVYSDMLKLPEKGHKYRRQALERARNSESPKITQSSWYVYSLEKVHMHEELIAERDRRHRKEHIASQQRDYHVKHRSPILEKLLPRLTNYLTKEAVQPTMRAAMPWSVPRVCVLCPAKPS